MLMGNSWVFYNKYSPLGQRMRSNIFIHATATNYGCQFLLHSLNIFVILESQPYRHIPPFIVIWFRIFDKMWEKSNCHLQMTSGIFTGSMTLFSLYKYLQDLATFEMFQSSDVSFLIFKERTDRWWHSV